MEMKEKIKEVFKTHPTKIFYGMIVMIVIGIAYSVYQYATYTPPKKEIKISNTLDPLSKGIGEIMDAASAMKRIKDLEYELGVILEKDSLTTYDSLKIVSCYEEIEKIISYIKKNSVR